MLPHQVPLQLLDASDEFVACCSLHKPPRDRATEAEFRDVVKAAASTLVQGFEEVVAADGLDPRNPPGRVWLALRKLCGVGTEVDVPCGRVLNTLENKEDVSGTQGPLCFDIDMENEGLVREFPQKL
jgi:hypothetical protein